MRKLLLITVGFALALAPSLALAAVTARTIVNPATNSSLSSAVMRNELQILEDEITNVANAFGFTGANTASTSVGIVPTTAGGTGLSASPAYGNLLVGNASSGYTLESTSSLNISAVASSLAWGNLTGTLSNQTDLQNALNAKVGLSSFSAGYPLSYNSGTGAFSIAATSSYGCTVSCFASPNISQWTNNAGYLTSASTFATTSISATYPILWNNSTAVISTAISTSTISNLPDLVQTGTITSGTWQGTAIADTYISSSGNWNTAYTDRITGANYPLSITSNVLSVVATSSENCTVTCFLSHNVSQWTNDAGYLTANQTITLSGAVSGSGTTAITTSYAGTLGNSLGGTNQNSSAWSGLAAVNAGVWSSLSTTSMNASITGNAGTATALQNARTINGISFNGTANIVVASTTLLSSDNNTFSGHTIFAASTTMQAQLNLQQASSTNFSASGTVYANNFYDTSAAGSSCIGDSSGILENGNCVASIASSGGTITYSSPTGSVNGDIALGHKNWWTGLQQYTNASSTEFEATSTVWLDNTKSALIVTDSNGKVGTYGGASACGSNNFVTTISALGATTCGTAAISGVNLGSNLNSLSNDGATLTGSSYNGSAAVSNWAINLTHANSWTGLQSFVEASSTLLSNIGTAYFGGSATSTFGSNGQLTLQMGAGTGNGAVCATSGGLLEYESGANCVAGGAGTVTSVATTWPVTGGTFTTSGTIAWNGLSTSTNLVVGNLPYSTGVNTFGQVATSSLGATSPITFSGTLGAQVGGTGGNFACATCVTSVTASPPLFSSGGTTPSITWAGISTSTNLVAGQVLFASAAGTIAGNTNFTFSTTGNTLLTVTNASTTNFTSGTWAGLNDASSTALSAYTGAFFGATATSSFNSVGTLTLQDADNSWSGISTPTRYLTLSAATTTTMTGTSSAAYNPSATASFAGTIKSAQCNATSSLAFINVAIYIGTSQIVPDFVASSTSNTITFTSNNTFTKGQNISAYYGSSTASTNNIGWNCTLSTVQTS